jgi:hypothetical protein
MCSKIRFDGEYEKFCKIFGKLNRALVAIGVFSSQNILVLSTVVFFVLFDNYCLIID